MLHFTRSLKKELSFYGFEPVNLITGSVLYEGMDFSFPGHAPQKGRFRSHSPLRQRHPIYQSAVH